MTTINNYPTLDKSYKGKFAFNLCTTSFVYPDLYAPNVRMIGPYLDEIELLFFKSLPENSLPSEKEIDELASLLAKFELACNVHLPLDIFLGDSDPEKREHAIKTVNKVVALTEPLVPSTCTVHFAYEEKDRSKKGVQTWQRKVIDSMHEILDSSGAPPTLFSVENLNYPFEWAEEIICQLGLRVCIDIGHFIQRQESFEKAFERNQQITDILHIYGVAGNRDHISLESLENRYRRKVKNLLKTFNGVVSLEVFSFENLKGSLPVLEEMMAQE